MKENKCSKKDRLYVKYRIPRKQKKRLKDSKVQRIIDNYNRLGYQVIHTPINEHRDINFDSIHQTDEGVKEFAMAYKAANGITNNDFIVTRPSGI